MMPNLSLDTAAIVSTVCEGILYGFLFLMFIGTLWTMLNGRPWKQVNHTMVVVAVLLFILSTIHMVVDIKRIHEGFVTEPQSTFIFKNAVYSFQTALGDGVVIFRSTAVGCVYTLSIPAADSQDIFVRRTGQWITSFYSTTLACNFISKVSILAYRLWTIEQAVQRSRLGKSRTKHALLIIIDSGVLYSATLLAALVCFVQKSNGQYVVLDMVTPIISIAFYMVILRVAIAASSGSGSHGGSRNLSSHGAGQGNHVRTIGGTYQMRLMQVHIEQFTEGESFVDYDKTGQGANP
ncbi:hypothetical protein C8J56DRAFT_1017464 [Mycena floridula]|nr:hypothetical protein C8J56DRAFT_1017464 [Mycena floridula]